MKKQRKIPLIVTILITFLVLIFLLRMVNPRELDDLNPQIPCSQDLIEKSDVLWVIPYYNNTPIDQNQAWCDSISKLNKTLGLHGIHHTYEEFNGEIKEEDLSNAIEIFQNCLKVSPEMFKPPQLQISEENKKLVESQSLVVKTRLNQITHKVYHCSDTGLFSNKLIRIF